MANFRVTSASVSTANPSVRGYRVQQGLPPPLDRCEFCVPCDYSQETTATGQSSWTSYAFCSGVATLCVCSEPPPPPTTEWGWSYPSWHMWWTLAGNTLDTLDNTAAFEVLISMSRELDQWCFITKDQPSRRYRRLWRVPQCPYLDRGMDIPEVTQGQIPMTRRCEERSFSLADSWRDHFYRGGRSTRPSGRCESCAATPIPTRQAGQRRWM